MSLETQVAALTQSTETLLQAVNVRKVALEEATNQVIAAAESVPKRHQGEVSVFEFMTFEQIQDVTSGAPLMDATIAVQLALNYAATYSRFEVNLPKGRYRISGISVPSRVILRGAGELMPVGINTVAVKLENTLYSAIYDVGIYLSEQGQIALQIKGSGSSYSQLNNFYNVKIDSSLPLGSVGIEIDNAFSNSFFGVNVLRAATGVVFKNAANANHFYGGELRCNNASENSGHPITHGAGCWSNGFHGTVIENWRLPVRMDGGVLTIDSGCYIEAFTSADAIQMNDGDLRLTGNYLNSGFVFVYGGNSITVNDNIFDGAFSNATYPFIQYRANIATRLNCKSNQMISPAGVLLRPREWRNESSVWAYRSIENRIEFIENKAVRFQGRLVGDLTDVTGDNTAYTVNFGANKQFDDGSNLNNSGVFTAPETGLYNLGAMLWLSGLAGGTSTDISVQIVTSNRIYEVVNQGTASLTVAGRLKVGGSAFVDMEAGDTATVMLKVAGSIKNVDIFRGDATNGYTMFSGFKVA